MILSSSLTTANVLDVFTDAVAARRGTVTDTVDDGERLLTRAVLPEVEEVRPKDRVQGGVALKATEEGVWLYPYFFRLVCRNGAIVAETLEPRSLVDLHLQEPDMALQSIRECIDVCCDKEVFTNTISRMRTACQSEADLAITLLPLVSRLSTLGNVELLSQIIDGFFREGDRSQFGLANAVTAVARDARDPELRWDLEEFGGGVAIGKVPSHPIDSGRSALERPRRLVSVG
ncbi:MAG: hypothetical protein RIC55_33940 [Pirellulaceae bacterium]